MTNRWSIRPHTEEDLRKRDELAAELGLSPTLCLLLVQRGIASAREVRKFFKPNLNDLHDPFLMPDMFKAVKRLNKALGNKEKILIYGDYDVDGTTAVSLVYKFLRPYSSTIDFYIPDRYDEGFYTELPPIVIDPEKDYRAVVETTKGTIIFDLLEKESPLAVNSFAFLAGEGWFDGNAFYRVKDNFIAETGDPAGNGMGNPGYLFANDVNDLSYGEAGWVGMVNGGKDKNGSKFFFTDDLTAFYTAAITASNEGAKEENKLSDEEIAAEVEKELAKLTESYPIFGKVIEGVEVIPTLTQSDSIVSVKIEVLE